MGLAQWLGLDKIVNQSSDEAQETIEEALKKLDPLLRDVSNRLGGIAHGLMDRVKVQITIEILPIGKAKMANPGIPDAPPK